MALDEDPNNPASYWPRLSEDQAAGTFWKCPCGEFNPGDYDTCHFCQRGNPKPDPQPDLQGVAVGVFTPTVDDMEGEFAGIFVSSLGEDGAAIALTGLKDRALEALDTYFREVCGKPNLLDDATRSLTDAYYYLDSGHAVFTRRPDGGWTVTPAPSNALGALPVTWFEGGVFGPVPEPYARCGDPRIW
jgi:hypothetical protein